MREVKNIDSKSCKEVYVILNKLGLLYKLPKDIREYIYKNQDISYKYEIDINMPLNYQIDNETTKSFISYLFLKYINDREEEKEMLLRQYEENEKVYQEKLREKYNIDNLFKNRNQEDKAEENIIQNEVSLVEYKESIFRRLINKIKTMFNMDR